jgi:photosystem II stability/assembly factor-like uncharacterized protein
MRHLSIFFFLLLTAALLSGQSWEPVSPVGGQIRSGLSVNGTLLVGTPSGIYRSTDGGSSYSPWSLGIPGGNITDLFPDSAYLFACIENKGIYRSADGGVTWELKLPGRYLSQSVVSHIRIQKADGHLMVRNSSDLNDTLYFSPDFGDSWIKQPISPFLLLNNQVFGFGDAFLTNSLAGVLGPVQGLYRSEDLGQSWVYSGNGMPAGQSVNNIVSINDTLYVLQKHIYRSTDNGLNWTQVTTDTLKNPSSNFAFVPAFYTVVGRTVYARNGGNASIVRSSWTPGQSRWQPPVAGSITTGAGLTMFSHAGKMFETGFDGEVYTASSPAQVWALSPPSGLYALPANDLSTSGSLVFGTTATQFLSGSDGSSVLNAVNPASIADNAPLRAVTRVGTNLILGTTDNFNNPLRLHYSQDQGATWQTADATTLRPEARMRTFGDSVVIYGTDGGALPVAGVLNAQGQTIAGLGGVSGFSGTTEWLAMTQHKGELYGLATRINNPSSRIFRRNATATTWTVVNQFLFPNGALSFESWQNKLYMGPALGGVLVSADDGASWTDLSSGLNGAVVNHLHAFGEFLAAATSRGIFLLEAGDSTWTDLSGDLPVADFSKVQSTPSHLWALAQGGAIWRLRREGNVSIKTEVPDFHLYPNPAGEQVFLSWETFPFAHWEFLDSQGRRLRAGSLKAGSRSATLPLGGLPPGLYLCRLSGERGQQSAAFLKQ